MAQDLDYIKVPSSWHFYNILFLYSILSFGIKRKEIRPFYLTAGCLQNHKNLTQKVNPDNRVTI